MMTAPAALRARSLISRGALACAPASALALICTLAVARGAHAQVPGELRGHVTDSVSALPLAGAVVEAVGTPRTVRSEADGSYVLRGLEPRSYTVRARAVGYAPREAQVEIANASTEVVDFALEPAATALAGVTVSAARDSAPLDAAVYDRGAIEQSGRRDLGELLESTPGVVITQSGGPGSPSRASIRGSSANEVLVLVDGVVINSPITGEADLSRIPLESVERVVVHTGARSARYGGRALAGVIGISTRRSTSDISALVRMGAFGELGASVTVGGSRPAGTRRLGASLTGDYRTIDGDFEYDVPAVRGGGRARRHNAGVTSRGVLGSLSLYDDESAGLGATLRGSWQELDRGLPGSIVQGSLTGKEHQHRSDAGLDATWRHGAITWTGSGDVTREHATYADPSPPFGTRYDDAITATAITASSELAVGSERLGASAGGELRTLRINSTTLAPGAPTYQRILGAFGGLKASREIGSSGTRVAIDLGARVDESSLESGATASARGVASVSRGIASASVSLGSGYAPPSLADQFFREGVLVRPNPNLRPERTRNDLEGRVGLRGLDAGPLLLSAEAAAYRADIDGMILWFPNFQFVWSPSNYVVTRSGWELSAGATLPAAGLDVDALLARSDVEYDGPVLSGQVAYRPRTTATVRVAWDARAARLEVSNRYVGSRRTVPGSPLNVLDPYWRTDVRATSTRSWGRWQLDGTLSIENIFDASAAMLVDYPFPSRGWSIALRVRRASSERTP